MAESVIIPRVFGKEMLWYPHDNIPYYYTGAFLQPLCIKLYPVQNGLWGRRVAQWFVGSDSGTCETNEVATKVIESLLLQIRNTISEWELTK
jgi:hypothetical protein